MTNEDPRPDYSELLKSPYEDSSPDKKEQGGQGTDDSEIPWKPAVFAAALGALLVGAFVIYAIVVSPDEPLGAAPTDTVAPTTTVPDPVPATEFPPSFTAVTESVGARVEAVDVSSTTTAIAVSTAVRGGLDSADVTRRTHENRTAAGLGAGFDVGRRVADHPGSSQVDVHLARRL